MMPLILNDSHYRSFLKMVEGNNLNTTTHSATFRVDGGGTFVCKLLPPDEIRLGNEIVWYVLAREMKVPAPPRAAILRMPFTKIKEILPVNVPDFYRDSDGNVLMWCTEDLRHQSVKTHFRASHARTAATIELLRHESAQRIAALDHMTAAPDRHDGNYVWISKSECVAIDNEFLFGYANWMDGPMTITTTNQLLLEAERHGKTTSAGNGKSIYDHLTNCMVAYGERHYLEAGRCYAAIARLIGILYGDIAAQHVLSSISERSFCQWMQHQLRQLI